MFSFLLCANVLKAKVDYHDEGGSLPGESSTGIEEDEWRVFLQGPIMAMARAGDKDLLAIDGEEQVLLISECIIESASGHLKITKVVLL